MPYSRNGPTSIVPKFTRSLRFCGFRQYRCLPKDISMTFSFESSRFSSKSAHAYPDGSGNHKL